MNRIRAVKSVGIVGLGAMGRPVARHIAAKGYTVIGFDTRPEAVAGAEGVAGATSCQDIARQSDLVLVAVGFDAEVEACVFAPDGLLAGAQDGAVIVVASTIAPKTMARIAERAKGKPVHFVDAPMTRGEDAAIAGKLLAMVGGDQAAVAAARPVLEAFTDTIHHLGPVGTGQVGKLVNNLILWACISANYEGMKLGGPWGWIPRSYARPCCAPAPATGPLKPGPVTSRCPGRKRI